MMLIIVDSHSKWIDVHVTTSSSASVTIEKLMSSFATHGLPHTIVSDNGPCFVSSEFELFNKMNVIRHIKVSPHHPVSNGLAERAVQTVKSGISKMEGGNLQSKVTRFLARYRITTQTTMGISTSQLLESTDAVPVAPTSNATRTTQFSPIRAKTSQSDSITNTRPKRNIREPNRLNLYLQ